MGTSTLTYRKLLVYSTQSSGFYTAEATAKELDVIGKQRTKESNIQLQIGEIPSLKEIIQSITTAEDEIKVEIRRIEQE